jgi:hypothetical protein
MSHIAGLAGTACQSYQVTAIGQSMGRHLAIAIYHVALVVTVVGVDILIFRHLAWARLLANVGIVLVFAAFYLRFQAAFRG